MPDPEDVMAVLRKLAAHKLTPVLKIDAPADGASIDGGRLGQKNPGIKILITWTTLLTEDTFKVVLDKKNITSTFTIDYENMRATGTAFFDKAGAHELSAKGQFLSDLVPVRVKELTAKSSFSIRKE
jgi:hypothetical protein